MKHPVSKEQKEVISEHVQEALEWLGNNRRALLSNSRIVAQSYDGVDMRDIRAQFPVMHKDVTYLVDFSLHISATPEKK